MQMTTDQKASGSSTIINAVYDFFFFFCRKLPATVPSLNSETMYSNGSLSQRCSFSKVNTQLKQKIYYTGWSF